MKIQVGGIYKVFYNENNINNIPKLYVLAIVDDHMVVIKFWTKRQRWVYRIVHKSYFDGTFINQISKE
ncbi:hypothetical protein LCGC14_1189620 [marine sediment metagenome]|uniref:Uncharacterized protein n=1 Tax=marine sediment metagenome TaxID=412755 RepID=A0A0F9M7J5_9ZZZZ